VNDLPAQLAVFPLPGASLLPGTQLQLNIFEPRYLNMVFDALAGSRMVGMVQPSERDPDTDPPELHRIGCAGRIVSFSETGDGRLLISLRGVCRYRLGEELALQRGFRRVVPQWFEFIADLQPGAAITQSNAEVKSSLQDYLGLKGIRVDWDGLEKTTAARAIDFLAMNLPFSADEKQALLEVSDVSARWHALLAIVQMSKQQADPTRH
jgi:Lon protease-like protein